jgi:hypothetical protein
MSDLNMSDYNILKMVKMEQQEMVKMEQQKTVKYKWCRVRQKLLIINC